VQILLRDTKREEVGVPFTPTKMPLGWNTEKPFFEPKKLGTRE
jgi:hypothetical protein